MSKRRFLLIIPFHRNLQLCHEKGWVGRIRELLTQKGQALISQSGALSGQGGVGKTAMAVEYAYRFAGDYPGGVFWLQMDQGLGSATRRLFEFVEKSEVDLGQWKRLEEPDLIRNVMSFFNQRPLKLIILDDLEGNTLPEELLELEDVQLVVTTWRRDLALPLIEMVLPDMEEALDIFLGYANRKLAELSSEEHEAAVHLCRRVDRLPLALEIMGQLARRRPIGSLAQDLNGEVDQIKAPARSKELTSIFAALRLVEHVLEHPRATEGLIAASYLNPEALGKNILAGVLGVDEVEAEEILVALANLSVLKVGKQVYTIHRLTQEAARLMDVDRGIGEKVARYLDNRVEEASADGAYREAYHIVPHLLHLGSLGGWELSEDEYPSVSLVSGWATYLWHCGLYPQAEILYSSCLKRFDQTKGKEHPRYTFHLNNLAVVLRYQGKYKEAERLYRQALDIHEKTIGEEHRDYATGLANLAGVLLDQGRYNVAEWLFRQALDIDEKTIGKEHPDYATRLNNLAVVLRYQGRDNELEELFREALDIGEKTTGKEHPSYATGLANLAAVLRDQGRYEEAEGLLQQALDIGEKTIGKEHPGYAIHLNELAMVLRFQGRYEAAEGLFRQALDIGEKTIGKEHPSYAIRLNNLAAVLLDQGRDEEAEELLRQI